MILKEVFLTGHSLIRCYFVMKYKKESYYHTGTVRHRFFLFIWVCATSFEIITFP